MRIVGIDTETHLITEEFPIPKLVCCTITKKEIAGADLFKHDDICLYQNFKTLLLDDEVLFAAHKASFDFSVLALQYPDLLKLIFDKYEKGLIVCTLLYEKLLALGHDGVIDRQVFSLADLVENHLGIDIRSDKEEGTWRTNFKLLEDLPLAEWPSDAVEYAKQDAVYAKLILMEQLKIRKIKDVKKQSFCDWLGVMTTKLDGLEVDQGFLAERLEYYTKIVEGQDATLVKHNFKGAKSKKDPTLKKNTDVIKIAVEECYKKINLPVPLTDTGKISCDTESLDAISGMHEGVDSLIALGSSVKIVNTCLLNWRGKSQIRPTLNMLTRTGRMSCYDPNLQNVNRDGRVRGCFVPGEGYVFCSSDYGQLELLTFAQVSYKMFKDLGVVCRMRDMINAGFDLHCVIGADLLKMPYADFYKLYKNGDKTAKRYRQMGKAANFGLIGGLSLTTFIQYAKTTYQVILTIDEAKAVFSAFFNNFPEAKYYLNYMDNFKISKDIGTFYKCEQMFTDRIRMVPENEYCSFCNTWFQGLASDIVKQAQINLAKATLFGEVRADIKLIIHDEFLSKIEKGIAHEVVPLIDKIMVDSAKMYLPDIDVIKVESCLMTRWEKAAEPVFENGVLVPWIYEIHGVKK